MPRYAINEIEMIDGDLMPEYHDDDTDIIKLVCVLEGTLCPPSGMVRAATNPRGISARMHKHPAQT